MANVIRAEFVTSQQGGQQILHNGFRYRLNVRRQAATHWKCVVKGCKGRCSTIGDHISTLKEDHTHLPENEDQTRLLSRLRQRVCHNIDPVQHVYNDEIGEMDVDAAATVATFPSVKSALYRHRRKVLPPLPKTRSDVILEGSWTETTDGHGEEDKILVFATTEMLEVLSESDTIFMDGTFFVCPVLWLQLYTVHCLVEGKMFPVAFCLLPNKNRATYTRLFTLLKEEVSTRLGVELSPDTVQTDFEVAAIRAVEDVFPGADIGGCFFHYSQALWRHVSEKGLAPEYREDQRVQSHVRRAAALPLLPADIVQDVWVEVMESGPDGEKIQVFNDYMTSTWLEFDARFPVRMWNQHGNNGPRTNNHLEGFHNGLKKRVQKSHSNIYELIGELKKMEREERILRRQLEHGGTRRQRSRVYRDLDTKIQRLKNQLSTGMKTPLQFVDAVGHLVKLQ